MKKQRNMFHWKNEIKTWEEINETEVSNLSDKEFKVAVIKMATKLRRGVDTHSKNFNKMWKI